MTARADSVEKFKKSDLGFLRDYNTKKILRILRDNGSASRAGMAETAHLDRKTVTNITQELLSGGYIIPVSKEKAEGGRPREMLSLCGEFAKVIGIDIGGTHISGVLMNFAGEVAARYTVAIDSDTDAETQIKLCDRIVERLLSRTGLSISDIGDIGIAFPGYYDSDTDRAILSENFPKWKNVNIKRIFEEKYKIPVHIDDCTHLMALAELWYGKVKSHNFLVFDLGYGIGCAIVINGKLYKGIGGKAGEIGHTTVKVDGPACTCGKNGCIESLASGWALAKQAKESLGEDKILKDLVKVPEMICVKDIVFAAEMGSEKCREYLESAGKYIAMGISNTMMLFNPEKIIIGGGLINDNEILVESIKKNVKSATLSAVFDDTVIEQSKLGEYASSIGAAAYCLQRYFE